MHVDTDLTLKSTGIARRTAYRLTQTPALVPTVARLAQCGSVAVEFDEWMHSEGGAAVNLRDTVTLFLTEGQAKALRDALDTLYPKGA